MKKMILALGILLISIHLFAQSSPGLGHELGIWPDQQGNPAFKATYTYGDDPDGKSYLLTFTPALPSSEKSKYLLWNLYLNGSSTFLLPWDSRRATQLAVIQVKLSDPLIVETILKGQAKTKGQNTLYFVLADRNSKSVLYNLPLSVICSQIPDHFVDMTYGKRCDQIFSL